MEQASRDFSATAEPPSYNRRRFMEVLDQAPALRVPGRCSSNLVYCHEGMVMREGGVSGKLMGTRHSGLPVEMPLTFVLLNV